MDKIPRHPIYFVKEHTSIRPAIRFVEEKPIEIEGVKPDHYMINNFGEVYNYKGQLIKPSLINSGYYCYRLYTGKEKPKYIHKLAHRLTKEVFDPIDNFDEMTVNHITTNRDRNELFNLEYLTQRDNNVEKERNLSSNFDNENNGVLIFNKYQIYKVIDEVNKGTSCKRILEILNVPCNKDSLEYVNNIKKHIISERKQNN